MNGPVSVSCTCAELWFSVSMNFYICAHVLTNESIDALLHRRSSSCLLRPAFSQPSYHTKRAAFYGRTNDNWFNGLVCLFYRHNNSVMLLCGSWQCGSLCVVHWSELKFKYCDWLTLLQFICVAVAKIIHTGLIGGPFDNINPHKI